MVRSDRGQLILVGAIAIALILLGLVLIVNTALFTQVVGSEGTVESAKEGGVSGQEAGDALAAVIAEANRENTGTSTPSISDDEVNEMLVERSVEGSGAFVDVSYVEESEDGTVIHQDSPGDMTNQAGTTGWDLVTDGDVGEFVITIDTAGSSSDSFDVTASNASDSRTLGVTVDSADEVHLSGAGQSGCSDIRATDGTVRIDVQHGRVYEDGSCSFDLFDSLEGPYTVRFDGGSGIQATYWLVTDDDIPTSTDSPSFHPAIWSFAYEFTYETPDATVKSDRREVDVYD